MLEELNRIFSPERRLTVLVVGDLILDEYLTGCVGRISPEAPVPVIESTKVGMTPGGAANVAANLASLGFDVTLCGVVGDDVAGGNLRNLLAELNIKTTGVRVEPERPTTHKLRVLAQGQHVVRIDRETSRAISSDMVNQFSDFLAESIPAFDGIICSDYQKGFFHPSVLNTIFAESKKANRRVVVDPKGTNYLRYRGAYALTPNMAEIEVATGRSVQTNEQLDDAVAELFEQTGAAIILATQGKEGMQVYITGQRAERIPTYAREVYDVTGAGDTVTALLGAALFAGAQPYTAAQLANCAAGLVVGKLGTATITYLEILEFLNGRQGMGRRKLISTQVAQEICEMRREAGENIVFTNGCFDFLHVGHVSYLQKARQQGDLLIVGVNSDSSVRALKGSGRPVMKHHERVLMLEALECVDYVVLFDDLTPERLISTLLPDVLVKGADYGPDEVVGKTVVEQAGGRLSLISVVEGCSTTELIARISNSSAIAEQAEG